MDLSGEGTGEYREAFPEQEEEEAQQSEELEDERLKPVSSTMVAEWGYRDAEEMLIVMFQNGHEQEYPCTKAQWEEAKKSDSPGRWMHENVL